MERIQEKREEEYRTNKSEDQVPGLHEPRLKFFALYFFKGTFRINTSNLASTTSFKLLPNSLFTKQFRTDCYKLQSLVSEQQSLSSMDLVNLDS